MKDIKGIFVLASLFLPFLSVGAFSAQEIAIQAGTILPISDAPIENGTILIKDGKIAALGQNIAVNSDVRVIDASGKFVMPGLIDAQSRLFVIDSEKTREGEYPVVSDDRRSTISHEKRRECLDFVWICLKIKMNRFF